MKSNLDFFFKEIWCEGDNVAELKNRILFIQLLPPIPPPCFYLSILRALYLADSLEDQTAEWHRGGNADPDTTRVTHIFCKSGSVSEPVGMIFEMVLIDFGLRDLAWEPFG